MAITIDRVPSLRIGWSPDDLAGGAEETRTQLADLGVEIDPPRDMPMLLERLRKQTSAGMAPSVARDLVSRRLITAANHELSRRRDSRRFVRVLSIDGDAVTPPRWLLVSREERADLAQQGVEFEALGRMVAVQLASLPFAIATIVLVIIAGVRGDRRWWYAALAMWIAWFVARIAGRRAKAARSTPVARPSR